jgi:hypothetical protein
MQSETQVVTKHEFYINLLMLDFPNELTINFTCFISIPGQSSYFLTNWQSFACNIVYCHPALRGRVYKNDKIDRIAFILFEAMDGVSFFYEDEWDLSEQFLICTTYTSKWCRERKEERTDENTCATNKGKLPVEDELAATETSCAFNQCTYTNFIEILKNKLLYIMTRIKWFGSK